MRLAADLFACQTKFRFRGIGRYSLSLISEMTKQRGADEMIVLADPLMPDSFEELRRKLNRLLPSGSFLPYYHEPVIFDSWESFANTGHLAEPFIRQAYQIVAPDWLLTPSFFDGLNDQGYVPIPADNPGFSQAMILYDLIPNIFPDLYLNPNPELKIWYLNRLNELNKFDLLLAISESTRQDAINLLGIPPDKVVNISGAANSIFHKVDFSINQKQEFLKRFNLQRPFVLYIGGDDHRKNMDGALGAFASLPRNVLEKHQLVLNDVGDLSKFRTKAYALGLQDDDFVVTGRLSDDDLVALYNLCKVSIYPTLYEGFGLPILEAMSCGAPVIASNNSSIPEVIGRSDAMFDVSNNEDVVRVLHNALTDEAYLRNLTEYGLVRAKQFSWSKTANLTWEAIRLRQNEKLDIENRVYSISPRKPLPRIAFVSPLPPDKSGVAEYSAALLPYLAAYFNIDLFTGIGLEVEDEYIKSNFNIYPWTKLLTRRDDYESVIYHIGNSDFHTYMVELIQEFPGIVVTHDFYLSNIAYISEYVLGKKNVFAGEIDDSHGLGGLIELLKYGADNTRMNLPINWKILSNAQALVCHSVHQIELMQDFYFYGWKPNPTIINQIRETVEDIPTSKKLELRKELGIDPEAFVFCSFGLMAPSKLNKEVIQAFHKLMEATHGNAVLIFVGPPAEGEYGKQTQKLIEEFQLKDRLMITGYKYKNEYDKYLACADAAIQLRQVSRGETSRAVLDSMAYGLPTVINAHGSLNDYCDDDVVKLTEVPDIDEIAAAMIKILTDKEFRNLKGQRAKDTIFKKHHPEKIARDYARVIERAICDDERKLFAPFIDTFSQIRPFTDLQSAAKYAALNTELRCQPRILVDVTGIQGEPEIERLVRNIFATNDRSIHFDIVEIIENKLIRANWAVKRFFNLPEQTNISIEEKKDILPGDILFLTPTFKVNSGQLLKIINDVKVKGGKIISMYDASLLDEIPDILYDSDVIICNSLKEANRVSGHSRKIHRKNALVDIYYFTYDQIPHKFKNGSAIDKEALATWLLGEIHETNVIKEFEKI